MTPLQRMADPTEIAAAASAPPPPSTTPATPEPRLSYHRYMVGVDNLQDVFLASSRLVAFTRCLPDAERQGCGVILSLNYSQAARDGLEAAARSFARFADQRGVRGEAARQLAISMAQMAPTHVWWRPIFERSRPYVLGHDDTWRSLPELRAASFELTSVAAEADEARTA